jgi:serine/threonine-protein kinase RsbW
LHITMTLSLPQLPSTVTRARKALTTLLSLTEADEEVCGHLAVLISEACANAVMHSAPGGTVDIAIVIDDDDCVLEIGNRGTAPGGSPFDVGLPDPLSVGGRGLPFIAALADTAAFVAGQPPGHVLLRLQKHLTARQSQQEPAPGAA